MFLKRHHLLPTLHHCLDARAFLELVPSRFRGGSRGGDCPPKTSEKAFSPWFCAIRKTALAIQGHFAVHYFVTALLWSIFHFSYSIEPIMRLECQILLKSPPKLTGWTTPVPRCTSWCGSFTWFLALGACWNSLEFHRLLNAESLRSKVDVLSEFYCTCTSNLTKCATALITKSHHHRAQFFTQWVKMKTYKKRQTISPTNKKCKMKMRCKQG